MTLCDILEGGVAGGPHAPLPLDLFMFIPPANFVCGGYTVFTLSVCACVRSCVCASVRACVRP